MGVILEECRKTRDRKVAKLTKMLRRPLGKKQNVLNTNLEDKRKKMLRTNCDGQNKWDRMIQAFRSLSEKN